MKAFDFYAEQELNISLQKAWAFFISPGNLSKITPPDLAFKVLTSLENKPVYAGLKIQYIVKPLFGIPVKWETLISEVEEMNYFKDEQLKGPYSLWEHTHTFTEKDGGVLMTDHVRYKLPLGILGRMMNQLFVRKRIHEIFNYRHQTLEKMFNQHGTLAD